LLQEKEYERIGENKTCRANVRVIAATNRDLEEAVRQGRFREDLFYRLNVISIPLPPLRDRPGDVLPIARSYLNFFARQCGKRLNAFSRDAEHALQQYSWPGNLRELRNVIERAVILAAGGRIDRADLPEKLCQPSPRAKTQGVELGARVPLEELETEHIARVIEQTATMEEAAKILGIDPATLYRKRKRMTTQAPGGEAGP
jgi:NtrC-family two-component system response regulator AlgB